MNDKKDNRPIFDRYPDLKNKIPFIPLGVFPTPVQKIQLKKVNKSNEIYIKRDDLSGEEYGGNKIRKLEFLIAKAIDKKAKKVMTFGTAGSNHCLATAICAKKAGLGSISMLRPQSNTYYLRENLLASYYHGAEIHYYNDIDECDKGEEEVKRIHKNKDGIEPEIIALGGSSALGNMGFVNAAYELYEQIERKEIPEPDYIYVATGTLGTSAGLTLGLRLLGLKTKVISVRVNAESRVNKEDMLEQIKELYLILYPDQVEGFNNMHFEKDIYLEHNFFGEEYSKFTSEGVNAIKVLYEEAGIALDGTYTGKAFAALLEDIKNNHENKVILFWNTKNSRDLSKIAKEIDYKKLPKDFHKYFEEDVQELDFIL